MVTLFVQDKKSYQKKLFNNFSFKHRPFLYLLTFDLAIITLLFLYIVSHWHYFRAKNSLAVKTGIFEFLKSFLFRVIIISI